MGAWRSCGPTQLPGLTNGEDYVAQPGGPRPDLVLLDLLMPVLDGMSFLEERRQDPALAAIPVIVLSACGDLHDQAPVLDGIPLVQKPVDLDQLRVAIRYGLCGRKPTVLVVEDEAAIRSLLRLALCQQGFAVLLAADGAEAVEAYRRHRHEIDVVLLDVQMPGLDGAETLAALRGIDPAVACCFMSAHTGRYAPEELLALGACGIVQKPFVLADLARKLRQFV